MKKLDFTVFKYSELINSLVNSGYDIQTYKEFIDSPKEKTIILRHDVDKRPDRALKLAQIEISMGVKSSFYFRAVKESWDENIIKKISSMGHEIGYHYENLTTTDGDLNKAIKNFEKNLSNLNKIDVVKTICMHGSPTSKYDSKDLWKKFNYRDYGIIGEPYFDIDFSTLFYVTDTARMWDGFKYNVRDKVGEVQTSWINKGQIYHKTDDIIDSIHKRKFPKQAMISVHPQRWVDNYSDWVKEYAFQTIKNQIKRLYVIGK